MNKAWIFFFPEKNWVIKVSSFQIGISVFDWINKDKERSYEAILQAHRERRLIGA